MVLSYIFEGEHYPYRIEENAEDLQEFIEHVANKRDVIIDGKASDIWKLLVDLDILDNILKDDRFEDFLNTKYKEKAYEDFLEYKEVMGESVEPEKNTRSKSKGEQIAQIVADLINKNGGIGPFGGEKVIPEGNTLHLYSQSPEEIYRFNDDGSVDFTNIESLLMDSNNWDDYGIEDEEEAKWVIKEYSHWKSVEGLMDSSTSWFYDLEGEEQALAEIDKVLKDHGEVVEESVSTLGRKRDAKGRFASIKPTYDDKDYDRVQISAYNTLKNKKPYAVIYAYVKDKSKVLLNPPLIKNSQAEVDEFVNSFKKGRETTKIVAEVFYLSQLNKIERALKERGLITEAKSSKPLKLYKYNGRAFNFDHELPIQSEYYVHAVSEKQALNNLRARIAKELDRDIKRFLVTLEDDKLKEVKPEEQSKDEEHFEKKFCDKHRKPVPLTDNGYCPICDDGVDEGEYFAEGKNTHFLTEAKADIEKFRNWLNDDDLFNLYYKLAPRLKAPYKDIYWIMRNSTKEDLKSYLDELDSTKSKSVVKREDLEGAKLVAENSSYKCYHITTYKASVIMGRGSKWCISMKNNSSYWKSYTSKGIKFYFFIGKNEKLALALYPKKITADRTVIDSNSEQGKTITNFELFNEKDETISYKISEYNLPQIPGVKLVYIDTTGNLDENGLYIDNNVVIDSDKNLTNVTIPEGVTKIGESAFQSHRFLENVKLPNSLLSIEDRAFNNCNNLTSVVIPNSVKTIGEYAFHGCESLTNIEIPNSVINIGNSAFNNCINLTSVVIPNSITTIGDDAFNNCNNLTSVVIPNSVTTIGNYAFHGCESLTNIEIPNSVTTIEIGTFYGCSNLASVVIPNSVTTIGRFAFSYCTSLTDIVIPSSVTTIGVSAFSDCSSLTSVVIPSSVTTIGYSAFSDCNNLTIYCEATSQPSGWDSRWNYDNRPAVWGYKGDKLEEAKETPNISFDDFIKDAESFKVDNSVILDLISEFEKAYKYYLNDFYFSDDTLEIVVRGDWKHDHVFIDFALPRFAKEKYNIDLIQKDTIEHDEDGYSDSDNYVATHVFKVM